MNKIIFIAGGGTGGHLFPAISIGQELIKNNYSIIFIGSKFGVEKEFFKSQSFKYYLFNIKGLQRDLSIKSILKNILFPIRFIISYFLSIILIFKYKPCAIIGTGGYASGLPLIAGVNLKIPIFIQDQNSIPGIITRKLSNYTKKIFLGYPEVQNLNRGNCIFTGNPIRNNLNRSDKKDAKKRLKFDVNKKLILIIGGSQGAHAINKHIINNIAFYIKNNFQILWQCGSYDINKIKNNINDKSITILDFIRDMSTAYSAADIVISRAGAIAISELTYFEKAMILIPLPTATENHQEINANYIESKKACKKIRQDELRKGNLESYIKRLLINEKIIKKLEDNAKKISQPNATKTIIKHIINNI